MASIERIRREAISARSSVNEILAELEGAPQDVVDPLPDPTVDPEPEEPQRSYIIAGNASGKPGDTVNVEILGSTHLPVNGFGLSVGCDRAVRLAGSAVSPVLAEMLNLEKPQKIVKQQSGGSWRENFIQVAVMFFAEVFSQEDIEGDGSSIPRRPRRTLVDLQIGTMLPIFTMDLRIPTDAKSGDEFALTPGTKYGRPLKGSDGRVTWLPFPSMYTTFIRVARHGIYPTLVSGKIVVE